MHRKILIGDVLEKIKEIPDNSIDLMMTSPPYLWLRDYGFEGQWGLEKSIDEYLDKMLGLMAEVKRVLKDTGSAVINMGDVYGGGIVHSDWSPGKDEKYENFIYSDKRREKMEFTTDIRKPYPNSLLFIPFQFGWRCVKELNFCCHNIIPWIKLNPMPFSGKNRFMNMWEPCLWFTKKPSKYFFDLDNVRMPSKTLEDRAPPKIKDKSGQQKLFLTNAEELELVRKTMNIPGQKPHGIHMNRSEGRPDFNPGKKQDNTPMADGKPDPTKKGFNDRWKNRKTANIPGQKVQEINKKVSGGYDMNTGEYLGHPNGKNPGDIFVSSTQPYPDAHYATFPLDVPLYFISCMCPQDGIVLDVFAGSGTTAEAAEKLARDWIMIEGSEENRKLIEKRVEPYKNERFNQV